VETWEGGRGKFGAELSSGKEGTFVIVTSLRHGYIFERSW
jgi:hypothetical protein